MLTLVQESTEAHNDNIDNRVQTNNYLILTNNKILQRWIVPLKEKHSTQRKTKLKQTTEQRWQLHSTGILTKNKPNPPDHHLH